MDFGIFVPCHRFIVHGAIGTEHARTMASLRRFTEHVMPHFKQGGAE